MACENCGKELETREFETIKLSDFNSYENSYIIKAACERYFEKIVEAFVDIAYLILKERNNI